MIGELSGSCACGSIQYILNEGKRSPVYACHCKDCQVRTGSAFCEHMFVQIEDLSIKGISDQYVRQLDNGSFTSFVGCPACKIRIYAHNSSNAAIASLRCGTLDCSAEIEPAAHFWVCRKQPWIKLPEEVAHHPTQPTSPAGWLEALALSGTVKVLRNEK